MRIEQSLFDTHAVLTLKGDFETDDARVLLEVLDELRARNVSNVAVSLRMVKYVNSTALGSLVKARKLLEGDGGEFVIVRPSQITREMIFGMGLDSVIPTFDDEEAAVEHFGGAQAATGKAPAADDAAEEGSDGAVALFSFADDRAALLPGRGRGRRGVGKIDSVDAQKIAFSWDPGGHGLGPGETDKMFAVGSPIHVKFKIKLIRQDYFDLDATIGGLSVDDAGMATVTATWARISESDKTALSQFTEDMDYLKQHVDDGDRS